METREHIVNELKEMNSSLVDRPAESSFSVPEGFFAAQGDILRESMSSILGEKLHTGELSVPDDFFKKQREEIMSEISEKNKATKLRRLWTTVVSIAAMLCLVSLGAYLFTGVNEQLDGLASLDDASILEYLSDETDMDEMLIASVMDMESDLYLEDAFSGTINDASISDYLLEQEDLFINEIIDDEYYDIF